ncbi:g-D-glutamyl-meso-diaminopimelate peptidase [Alkalibacillus flavidus]|uniref:G-D-glutamyl-meso-diaminopimelate peptidase n=1 Tax=Alkalibacillus flavidus TaxID=546021 RepID=A0ABV2KRU1_9BACI
MKARESIHDQAWYTHVILHDDLRTLQTIVPQIQLNTIGYSVLGKPITEVVLGRGETIIHMNGSMHAHESITTNVLMRFIADYIDALIANSKLNGIHMDHVYDHYTFSLVPLVNPDGVDLMNEGVPKSPDIRDAVLNINNQSHQFDGWKANIRGVDLNNQFPANWAIEQRRKPKQPAPRDFPGYTPLTEPEAIAMYHLARLKPFDRVLAFHTQGEVIYWGYEGLEPERSHPMVQQYAKASGYQPVRYVDSHAGYKDWFIQAFQRPGFTVELGRGVNPLPITDLDTIYPDALNIIIANVKLDN